MREKITCEIFKPTIEDLREVYACAMAYGDESAQVKSVPFSKRQVLESLTNILIATNFVFAAAEHDGKVVGIAFGYFGLSWWDEPDGGIDMFFVRPEYRGTNAARGMVAEVLEQFKSHGCGFVYAGAESKISLRNTRIYENLYKKFGFEDTGGGRMIKNLRG